MAYGTGGLLDKVKDLTSMAIAPSAEAYAEHVHPAVTVHPVTAKPALYVNPVYTTRFEGWTKEESQALLAHLYRHSINENFTCRLRWAVHTLAIWDNRCTMHNALNDYSGVRREMYRTSVKGSAAGRGRLTARRSERARAPRQHGAAAGRAVAAPRLAVEPALVGAGLGRELAVQGDSEVARTCLDTADLQAPLVVGGLERSVGTLDGGVGQARRARARSSSRASSASRPSAGAGAAGRPRMRGELDHHDPRPALAAQEEGGGVDDLSPAGDFGNAVRFHRGGNGASGGDLLGRMAHFGSVPGAPRAPAPAGRGCRDAEARDHRVSGVRTPDRALLGPPVRTSR